MKGGPTTRAQPETPGRKVQTQPHGARPTPIPEQLKFKWVAGAALGLVAVSLLVVSSLLLASSCQVCLQCAPCVHSKRFRVRWRRGVLTAHTAHFEFTHGAFEDTHGTSYAQHTTSAHNAKLRESCALPCHHKLQMRHCGNELRTKWPCLATLLQLSNKAAKQVPRACICYYLGIGKVFSFWSTPPRGH